MRTSLPTSTDVVVHGWYNGSKFTKVGSTIVLSSRPSSAAATVTIFIDSGANLRSPLQKVTAYSLRSGRVSHGFQLESRQAIESINTSMYCRWEIAVKIEQASLDLAEIVAWNGLSQFVVLHLFLTCNPSCILLV